MTFKDSAFWPNSHAARTSFLLMTVIVISQLLSSFVWYQQSYSKEEQGLKDSVRALALSAASTIRYFHDLPEDYRHLALNQLRNMGGAKFFVSLNDHAINQNTIEDSPRKTLVVEEVTRVFVNELDQEQALIVDFTPRQDLRVFNQELSLDDLPQLWGHYSISSGTKNSPILVIQAQMSSGDWFYLAAMLPAPYSQLESTYLDSRQIVTLVLSALLLLVVTWAFVKREIRPIKDLGKAAKRISQQDHNVPIVEVRGSEELRSAVDAFNQMNLKVNSFIRDREQLFSSISHDLKTPIACLKLRAEMLDDDTERDNFTRVINDLDLLVKGALQCMKETDIHEDIEPVDLLQLIKHCQSIYPDGDALIAVKTTSSPTVIGKPLALKRCFQNLLDNGIKYGKRVDVFLKETDSCIEVQIDDYGKGVGAERIDTLFKPYYRANDKVDGSGLGLSISQSIAKAHGGKLHLYPASTGGLSAIVTFNK